MPAIEVLQQLQRVGIVLDADPTAGRLIASPASRLSDELRHAIRECKAELFDRLACAAYCWRLRLATGETGEVFTWPPSNESYVRAFYPNALDAVPVLVLDCATCRHCKRPGQGVCCCTGRDDLPRVYGDNHPARRLPENRGVDCSEWSEKHD